MDTANRQTFELHVVGMHCRSCVLLTDSELSDLPHVSHAASKLETRTVRVTGDFGGRDAAAVATELSAVLQKHGYRLSVDKPVNDRRWHEFKVAVPAAAAVVLVFVALQKAGIVNLLSGGDVTLGTAFAIGIAASLSTCMAVVGGLLLAMSASLAKAGDGALPQLSFHFGRLAAFFVLGGAVGAAGGLFRLSTGAMIGLNLLLGLVMLVMGVNLLDVFDAAKRMQPTMPTWISRHAMGTAKMRHALAPLLVGVATFFLPCGFTQSMQLYALTTGSFVTGSAIMLAFALGTLPVLAMISFGAYRIEHSARKSVFLRTAGIVVIVFALLNVLGGLTAAGLIPPYINL